MAQAPTPSTPPPSQRSGLPAGLKVGLPVIVFGALVILMVVLTNGSGIPTSGDTPILDVHATNQVLTEVAANALLAVPDVTATAQTRLRAQWTHHTAPGRVTALAQADGHLYVGGEAGLFQVEGEAVTAVAADAWAVDADGQVTVEGAVLPGVSYTAEAWHMAEASAVPDGLQDACPTLLGAAEVAADDLYWLACAESLVHADRYRGHWLLAVIGPDEGLPAAPTGALLVDDAGRVYVGLADGLGVFTPTG